MPVAEVALLGASIVGITLSWRGSDWHPFGLWLLLLAIALLSDLLAIRVASNARISASFIAIVLAMALLGPAPAAALGVATTLTDFVYRGRNNESILSDMAAWAAFPLIGGLMVRYAGDASSHDINFGLLVFGVFAVTNFLNFVLVMGPETLKNGTSFPGAVRTMFIPLLPSSALAGALAVATALTYNAVGFAALISLLIVLLLSRCSPASCCSPSSARRSSRHAPSSWRPAGRRARDPDPDALAARPDDRAPLRRRRALRAGDRRGAGLLATSEQDLVHTAGLLHDIGKFIFPDRILFADRKLTEEDWEIVKKHPARARSSSADRRATARSRTSSSPTTSASTARATRTACPASRSR